MVFWNGRPIRASVFAQGQLLWLLSDDTTSFGDSFASYRVEREDLGIRGGGGLRLSWVGWD